MDAPQSWKARPMFTARAQGKYSYLIEASKRLPSGRIIFSADVLPKPRTGQPIDGDQARSH
jgi:hypothetical protein